MDNIRQLIFEVYRNNNISAGHGLLVQAIRAQVFNLVDLRQNQTIGNDLTIELNNLIKEGILRIAENENNMHILTEEGETIIYDH